MTKLTDIDISILKVLNKSSDAMHGALIARFMRVPSVANISYSLKKLALAGFLREERTAKKVSYAVKQLTVYQITINGRLALKKAQS
jgi:predicted MarR family transcription regulator